MVFSCFSYLSLVLKGKNKAIVIQMWHMNILNKYSINVAIAVNYTTIQEDIYI